MRRHPRLVGFLWRWHRRLGLFAALLALLLAITGIALNHTSGLGLDQRYLTADWLYSLYGEKMADLPAYRAGDQWLSRSGAGTVFADTRELAPCRGALVGALALEGLLYAACEEELLLATTDGELVEAITSATGLPGLITGIGTVDNSVALQIAGTWQLADLDRLSFDLPLPEGALIQQLAPGALPQAIRDGLPAREAWLTWERLLLDLHSGRLAGTPGVFLVDIAGLMFCLLGVSGVAMWYLHHRAGRRRP